MTVDDYLAELPDDAREVLERIRAVIATAEPEAVEQVSYGIPLFKLNGKHLIGYGGFKEHLSLFVMDSRVFEIYASELADYDVEGTKSTIRFTIAKPPSDELVRQIVATRRAELEAP